MIDTFKSDYLREPFFNWNPPTRSILTIACNDDIDDNLVQLDFDSTDDNDNDADSNKGENPHADNDDDDDLAAGENPGVAMLDTNNTRGTPSGDDNFGGNQPTHNGLLYSHLTNNGKLLSKN